MQKVATISTAILLLAIALVPVPVAVYSTTTTTPSTEEGTNTENSESAPESETEPESTETEPTDSEQPEIIIEPPKPVIPEVIPSEPEPAVIPPSPTIECPEGQVLDSSGQECLPENLAKLGELVGPPSADCAADATALECLQDVLDGDISPLEENGTSPLPSPSPEVEVEVNVTDANGNDDDNQTNGNGNYTNGDDDDDDDHEKDKDDRKKRHDHFKRIVKNIDIHKTVINQNEFPDVDIIGLSIKDNGEAIVCIMEIDGDNVQCQEFGVPNDRINQNVWRIIETDKDDNFDNGDTGSDDVDDAIDAIKAYDFSELKDIDNHEFDVDLTALGINPKGEGLVCLLEDDKDEGTALCESFKVANEAISGQITEITEMD